MALLSPARFLFALVIATALFPAAAIFPSVAMAARQDFDGDGIDDLTLFDPSTGRFTVRFSSLGTFVEATLGAGATIPVTGQYNFPTDGRTDLATFDRSNGRWRFNTLSDGQTVPPLVHGAPGDLPTPADYDGNGCDDLAVFNPRGGVWTIAFCGAPATRQLQLGSQGDIPLPNDYDGDAVADIAVFTPKTGVWSYAPSRSGGRVDVQFGLPGDIPLPGRYLEQWKVDIAVYRPQANQLLVRNPETGQPFTFPIGVGAGDIPAALDLDGDGKTDLAVFHPDNAYWIIRTSAGHAFDIAWPAAAPILNSVAKLGLPPSTHLASLIAPAGDFDGDGRTDIVHLNVDPGRAAKWNVQSFSRLTFFAIDFGSVGDTFLAGDTDGDGIFEPLVTRPNTGGGIDWFIHRTGQDPLMVPGWGLVGDRPLLGDFDCDGKDDLTQLRNNGGFLNWFIRGSTGVNFLGELHGIASDTAYAADLNGDGCDDMVAVRNTPGLDQLQWFARSPGSGALAPILWGLTASDSPVAPMDFNGDGVDDVAVVRAGERAVYARLAEGVARLVQTGPVPTALVGNFDAPLVATAATIGTITGSFSLLYASRLSGLIMTTSVFVAPVGTNHLLSPDGQLITQPAAPATPAPGPAPVPGGGSLSAVCSNFIGSGYLWKPASQDSGGTREGKPMIFITRGAPAASCLPLYAANGQKIGQLGRFSSERFYIGYGCGTGQSAGALANAAVSAGGSKTAYVGNTRGGCFGPFNPESRQDRR